MQRRVITEGERTEAREWLSEVASAPLVQSVQDAHRAWQNFFDSCTGKLYIAKVGEVRVRWSRDLPSTPTSVTVIREPDGRYYASFVVERDPRPLSGTEHETGVDLGISRLATCADTDGNRSDAANPKHLQRQQRKLRRVQREKSRGREGSANRDKSRREEAVQHGKVARARREYHHKQALKLVRENQVVHVEDLNVAGMVRNRKLARAISDAGWGRFVRIIEEKAAYHGRAVHTVNRWLPSSKTCSACHYLMDAMPLRVRDRTCPGCGAQHERDFNAATIILAAGRAERVNARGARVSPPSFEGVLGEEAGSSGKPRGSTTRNAA
ncbi:putative transposase [Saccharopolyspora lacisalsi]|uniref:Putative transposase n=1 Tax=Halosaccharopolyspora lacisalsi TaxID=1000566 RepID=A0A839DWB9_9PSEU|nr:RNA-guided endonuclease TnpB family protein [Halosaccharopolyspora lacisalsi]MBA8823625.1 putative transposase [Halosaccharopolyspora lacisalsi]